MNEQEQSNGINLASQSELRGFMEQHGLFAKKNYGQNFLIDARVLERIVEGADISPEDTVIEIGPGMGVLTRELAKYAKKVIAVEIDKDLIPILQETMKDYDNVSIVHNDVLKVAFSDILPEGSEHIKVVANLPYYITTPIIFKVLESDIPIESMVVMVQKEVGDRMRAQPSTKAYGALSLTVSYYATVEQVANVPPNCFFPRPDIDSAVIKLNILKKPQVIVQDKALLFQTIKAGFSMRRKTMVNCLSADTALNLSKEEAIMLLESNGFSPNIRGEALSLEEFSRLANGIFSFHEGKKTE